MLYETQKRNVVSGYTLTRLAPLGPDSDQRTDLCRMLNYIDPCIVLTDSTGGNTGSDYAEWYKNTFGVPGTPEFEENVRKMNEKLHDNG